MPLWTVHTVLHWFVHRAHYDIIVVCTTCVYRMCLHIICISVLKTSKTVHANGFAIPSCWNAQKVDGADTFEWLTFWSSTTGHICKETRWRNQLDAHWMKAGLSKEFLPRKPLSYFFHPFVGSLKSLSIRMELSFQRLRCLEGRIKFLLKMQLLSGAHCLEHLFSPESFPYMDRPGLLLKNTAPSIQILIQIQIPKQIQIQIHIQIQIRSHSHTWTGQYILYKRTAQAFASYFSTGLHSGFWLHSHQHKVGLKSRWRDLTKMKSNLARQDIIMLYSTKSTA